ncbi:MOR1B protein, partial [Molothrus ater]|nr:MOR1B protein [Molothrus ater]
VGNSSVLTCFLKGNITMLTWTITPKAGGLCTLVYRRTRTAHPSCSKLAPCMSPCWCFAAPPRLSLSCDEQGSPVCEAAAGKPPAQLSWVPEGSSTAEEKCYDNGTVTVLSKFTACSTNVTNVTTCMVSHPAGNWSQSISC